ncbi:MAG TPA: hypothetical protein VMU94_08405 [Streptosporangiaceae bacterium]|nr:hypothetical protein [Streptosporangiaceae bacterium]
MTLLLTRSVVDRALDPGEALAALEEGFRAPRRPRLRCGSGPTRRDLARRRA